MRLLFLILALLVGSRGWASGPVTFTVCASGCTVTSIANAKATMTATTTPGTVELKTNDGENVNFNSNAIDTVIVDSGRTWNGGGNVAAYNTGCSVPCTIISSGSSPGTVQSVINGGTPILIASTSSGFSLFVSNMSVSSPVTNVGGTDAVSINSVLPAGSLIRIKNCKIYSNLANGIEIKSLITTAHSLSFQGNIISAPASIGYLDSTAVSGNDLVDWDHNTFANCVTAYISKSGEAVTNNLYINNTADLSLTSPAVIGDFINCQFGQQASGGTNCLYGATLARTFSDRNFFYPGPQDQGLNSAVSTGLWGTVSQDGVMWGSGNINTIGANAYSLALCGGYGVGK